MRTARKRFFDPATEPVRTREDAGRNGLTHFYTGLPCQRGHYALRYVSTGACVTCMRPPAPLVQHHTDAALGLWMPQKPFMVPRRIPVAELADLHVALQTQVRLWCVRMGYNEMELRFSDDDE